MQVRALRSLVDVQSLAPAWDELHRETANSNPFLTSWWTLAWLEHTRLKPFVLAAYDGTKLRGVLPLATSHRRLHFVEGDAYGFIGAGESLADALTGELASRRQEWDAGVFAELLDDASPTAALAEACSRHGLVWQQVPTSTFPYVDLMIDPPSYDKKVGKKVINEVNRRRRQLEELGTVRCIRASSRDDVETHFAAVVDLHKRRWADRTDSSAFIDERRTRAMHDAAIRLAEAGAMALDLLLLDERLIAFSYGFDVGGRHVYYSPAFDPAFAPYSVSKILLQWQLTECRRRGLKEFDFSRGEEPYKLVWATGTRKASTVVLSHDSARSRAAAAVEERKLRTRAWLRSQPRIVHFRRVTWGRVRHSIEPATLDRTVRRAATALERSLVDRGVIGTVTRIVNRALEPVHSHAHACLYFKALPAAAPQLPADVSVDVLRGRDLDELARGGRYDIEYLVRAYYGGARCYAARLGGELASYAWATVGRTVHVPELERDLVLRRDQAYLFDCYTLRPFRGRGLYPLVLGKVAASFDKSIRSVYIIAEADNRSSSRGIEKAGFVLKARIDDQRWGQRSTREPLTLAHDD